MNLTNKKILGVVVSDGVGFRNFILSDFISESKKVFHEVVIFSCLPLDAYKPYAIDCKIIELPTYKENYFTWFFRKAKEVAHLQKFALANKGMAENLKVNNSSAKTVRGISTKIIFAFTSILKSEKWILRFNKWQQFTYQFQPSTKKFKEILIANKVDLLFFTHQRPPFIAPLIDKAEKLNIKTSTFIFSWDNLASKGRMAGNFNYYIVWSDFMKQELLQFYASIKSEQIVVSGTPQFEPYVLDRYSSTKQDFFQSFKLNTDFKTICFSCGDISTSQNDELYIEIIAEFIIQNKIQAKVNFIVRTSPAESPERFYFLKDKYPFINWNYPKWVLSRINHPEPWSQRVPSAVDIKDLRSLLTYCDLNINMCSTMSLDFMLFDKPVINPVFGNEHNGLFDDQRFLEFAHYKKIVESNSVIIAKNKTELLDAINDSLTNPEKRKVERESIITFQIGHSLKGTSRRIANTLFQWG